MELSLVLSPVPILKSIDSHIQYQGTVTISHAEYYTSLKAQQVNEVLRSQLCHLVLHALCS